MEAKKNDDQIGLRMLGHHRRFFDLKLCEAAGRIASNGWIFGLAMGGKTKMEIQFGIKNGWGSQNYNIMGVAKAELECAVRYVASEVGPKGIRVHAISPGPLVTRAASGIPGFVVLSKALGKAPTSQWASKTSARRLPSSHLTVPS